MLRSKRSYKSDSDTTKLHSRSRARSVPKETYSKEQRHVPSVHKENWDYNTALKYPSRESKSMSTDLKKMDLTNSVENESKMSSTLKRKSCELGEIIPKRALKSMDFKEKNNCQENTSSPLRNVRRSSRKSTSKYRTKMPGEVEADEADSMYKSFNSGRCRSCRGRTLRQRNEDRPEIRIEKGKPLENEIKLRNQLRWFIPDTDIGKSTNSEDETDCRIPMKMKEKKENSSVTTGDTMSLFANNKTQPVDDVPVNITKRKRGRPRKSIEIQLLNDKRKRHKKLEVVPVSIKKKKKKKKKQRLSHTVHSYEQYIKKTEKMSYITKTFSQITLAESSETGINMNQNVISYKNDIDTNKVSVIPLVRIEDMPLSQLSKLLQPMDTREIDKTYYEKKTQHSAYVTRTTKVEQGEGINVLYHESVCEKQQINMIKKMDTNVNRETNRVNASSNRKIIDSIRILKLDNNGYDSQFTIEDVLQLFLKLRNLKYRSMQESDCSKTVHTCAAMCNNCKEAFDLLHHFSSKVNLKNETLSVECIPCDLRINFLSHLQEHVMNVHLKCEGKDNNIDYPVHLINFNEELDKKNFRIISVCCCCSKVFKKPKLFKNHVNSYHTSKIFKNCNNYNVEQMVENPQLYELCKNVHTSNEDYTLNRSPIFDIANNISGIYNERRDINLVNHDSIQSCINTTQVNITNSLYCNNLNSESTLLEWTMQVREKNIILQGNNDSNHSRGKISGTIEAVPMIEEQTANLNICEPQAKVDSMLVCHLCSKSYKRKRHLLNHISLYCKARTILNEQRAEDTSNNSTTKLGEDSVASDTGITNLHDGITNSEEPSQPETPEDTTIADREVDDAGNENVECAANENDASMENDASTENDVSTENDNSNQILHINLMEKSEELASKIQQSFKFNISITKITKDQEEIEDENELPVSLIEDEEETTSTQENVSSSSQWCCDICGEQFVSRAMFIDHMFFSHDVEFEYSKSLNQLSELFSSDEKNQSPRHNCILEKKNDVVPKLRKRNGSFKRDSTACQIFKRSKKWRCGECKENFAFLRNYLRHKYDCHEDESVVHICDNCNRILTSVKMVNTHVCMKVTTWACKRCSLYFPNGISLMRHNEHSHFESVGPHVCEMCGSTFLTDHMLRKHRTKHANDDSSNMSQHLASDAGDHLPSTSNVRAQTPDDDTTFSHENPGQSEMLEELNKIFSKMYITCDVNDSQEVIYKCNNCSTLRPTESAMTEHLIECCKLDICQICNDVKPGYKLTEHLIHEHMVADYAYLQENDVEGTVQNPVNDTINILGLKRLLSLYEYQKFDGNIECIECELCTEQFASSQLYKVHYLKYHDKICLLCNIEFDHNVQALEHKTKIHKSFHLYLWIVQMLLLAVSRIGHYGNTIEQVILKSSEIRMC
ncbi:uncharacterized protein LOC108626065 [Ceratina calcarata]|uniref:Uncharacterized protein LOC108626065 n=1 Tax=Ceratina calcarata TaxID=156304 RepID=A0AAJ7N7V4_9HYME|nr:uncharacterized protein LOC108626065 [Ceratina calcarata]XP_017881964.1 uncharacterized protein LOC108626065 [Ceratina calcarata]XP_026670305.1 uncharacterized protein LOC108626065 [Ceratina calcarata]